MKKKTHFIVLAAGLQESSLLLIPKSLVPLGHHPMVCILIETLLEIENVEVHLLVSSAHETLFGREMKRWFPRHDIHVFGSDASTTSESLFEFLQEKKWDDDHACHILQSNFPLLSCSALEHFLHVSSHSPSAVLGVNKTRWNEDRVLRNLVVEEGHVMAIEESSFAQVGFLACSKFSAGMLREYLPATQKYHEVITCVKEKPLLVKLQSYPIELDSIGIRTVGDKTFAEHKFMEKQHADFLTQCYCIWKECRSMEARIVKLENQSKK